MTRFEPMSEVVGSDRSANSATATVQITLNFVKYLPAELMFT